MGQDRRRKDKALMAKYPKNHPKGTYNRVMQRSLSEKPYDLDLQRLFIDLNKDHVASKEIDPMVKQS
jgi:hypothetical protein